MFLQKIKLENLLSFKDTELELRPLNVLIGPNASGKSNLIRAIGLLRSLPTDLSAEIAAGGGPRGWINQRTRGNASIQIAGALKPRVISFDYKFSFAENGPGYRVIVDKLDSVLKSGSTPKKSTSGKKVSSGLIPPSNGTRSPAINIGVLMKNHASMADLASRTAQEAPPAFKSALEEVRLYREFHTGPDSNTRRGVAASALGEHLSEDGGNLALVLANLELQGLKPAVNERLKRLYEPFEDIVINPRGGIAQLYVWETGASAGTNVPMSALSLSDGTLRLLCLLSILLDPDLPPLVCIEEPAVGLHPDAVRIVADLLREASERTQLIVTTHSPALIDALSDQPESIVVCERDFDGFTQLRRLKSHDLDVWLERYSLGELWQKGEIGGNRW